VGDSREARGGGAADRGQQQRFGQELCGDVSAGGAERGAQADLGAALEHGDDHHVDDPDAADEQRDSAEARAAAW
jgi:hypothetical protein